MIGIAACHQPPRPVTSLRSRRGEEVIRFGGDYVPYAASRIRNVAGKTRNYVKMEVEDRLPSRNSLIEAYVEPIGVMELTKQSLRAIHGPPNSCPFVVM